MESDAIAKNQRGSVLARRIRGGLTGYQIIFLVIGGFLQFGHALIPNVLGLNDMGMGILCITVGTMLQLILVDVQWPIMLCLLAFPATGVFTFDQTVGAAFGNQTFWFVMFSGMIFYAMQQTGLLRRIALWSISRPFTKKNPWYFVLAVWVSGYVLGLVIDVVALIMLYTNILIEIFEELKIEKGSTFSKQFLMGTLIVIGLSYGATPIGHVITLFAISYFEPFGLTFTQFTIGGSIIGFVVLMLVAFTFRFLVRMDLTPIRDFDPTTLQAELATPWTKRQLGTGAVYLFMVVLWLLPSFVQGSLPALYDYLNVLTNCMPLVVGVVLMCIIPIEGKPLMVDFTEALRNAPWSAMGPTAAAQVLGFAIKNTDGGVPAAISGALEPILGTMEPVMFVVLVGLVTVVLTNFMSDMATCLLMSTIVASLISGGVVAVEPSAMGIVIGMLACTAYMTAPASTYAAYIAGTGWIEPGAQAKYGLIGLVLSWVVIVSLGYAFFTVIT